MNALGYRWNGVCQEHIPTLQTTDTFERNATSVTVRCSCGEELGTYVMPDQAIDACETLAQDLIQLWAQLQILHHRNAKLTTEQGWTPPPEPTE